MKIKKIERGMSYDDLRESIRPCNLDMNNKKVLGTVFEKGNFTGIFQFTEKGIRKVAMKIHPDCFEDVSAICALYRPGPLKSHMDKLYADYKHGNAEIKYIHPLMEEILSETYGCLVYQEQMLEIGTKIGLLSMKDTNRLRKLLLKKDKSKKDDFLEKEKLELQGRFVEGCVKNGMEEKKSFELWEMLEAFGGYGFNNSHAKCYAALTMQTAYLRTYYPLEFFAALLTYGKADDLQSYVDDIRRQGFEILPVDINKSGVRHRIEGNAIRLALGSVLGVGARAAQKIVDNQPYSSLNDYLYKTGGGKTATLPLIKIQAFSEIEKNSALVERQFMIWADEPKLRQVKNRDEFEKRCNEIIQLPFEDETLISYEQEFLGFNLRVSPFDMNDRRKKIALLEDAGVVTTYEEFINSNDRECAIPVIVKSIKARAQRNGKMMSFMRFGDHEGAEFDAPCFAGVWCHISEHVKKGGVYVAIFNRKPDEERNLIVGRSGWAHSQHSSMGYMLEIDEIR